MERPGAKQFSQQDRRWRSPGNLFLGFLTLAVLAFTVVRFFVFQIVTVEDHGMEPSLHWGDRVLVDRTANTFSPGDVVVFSLGDTFFVRRIVAAQGDRIRLRGGVVELNGFEATLTEGAPHTYAGRERGGTRASRRSCFRHREAVAFLSHEICLDADSPDQGPPVEASPAGGTFYVLCDNRAECRADSRDLGAVRKGAIRGRVTHIVSRQSPDKGGRPGHEFPGLWEEL